jgi:hypothetical protein
LRGIALQGSVLAKGTAGTIRLRLFKVAAMVVVSVWRVHVRMASAFPMHEVFRSACERLRTQTIDSSGHGAGKQVESKRSRSSPRRSTPRFRQNKPFSQNAAINWMRKRAILVKLKPFPYEQQEKITQFC